MQLKALRWLDEHFEEVILTVFLILIAVIELLQVIARNTPVLTTFSWAEEACRYIWVASVFVSLPYTIRNGTILRVTAVGDILPWKARNVLDVLVDVLEVAISAVLAYNSISVFQSVWDAGELSAAMLMPIWIVYVFVVLGLFLSLLRSIQMLVIHIKNINVQKGNSVEEAAKLEMEASDVKVDGFIGEVERGEA